MLLEFYEIYIGLHSLYMVFTRIKLHMVNTADVSSSLLAR